jgi:hypothetical protein
MVNKYLESIGVDIKKADDNGNPSAGSAASAIGKQIKQFIKVQGPNLDPTQNLLTQISNADVQTIINAALGDVIKDSIPPTVSPDAVIAIEETVKSVTTSIVTTVLSATNDDDLKKGLVAAQTLVTSAADKAEDLMSTNTAVREAAKNTITQVATVVQSEEFKQALNADTIQQIDVKQLATDISEGKDAAESVANSTLAEAPTEGEPGIWANRVLSMSGKSEDGRDAGRVLIFFDGANDAATSGDVSICYAYKTTTGDDVQPTLIEGTWQELNTRGVVQLNQDLISFTIKAQKQDFIPEDKFDIVVGLDDTGGANPDMKYGHLRFKSDEGSAIWFSDIPLQEQVGTPDTRDFGLVEIESVPTTPEQCASFTVNGVENALLKNLGF